MREWGRVDTLTEESGNRERGDNGASWRVSDGDSRPCCLGSTAWLIAKAERLFAEFLVKSSR